MISDADELPKPPLNDLLERLTLGVSKSLEKRLGVCDVSLTGGNPTERHQIVSWEQRNACMLPDDLKNFYLTTDGLLLSWSVSIEENKFPVGKMEINPFAKLAKINSSASTTAVGNTSSLADVECSSSGDSDDSDMDEEDNDERNERKSGKKIHFDGRSRIFELSAKDYGKICLVYRNTTPGLPAHNPQIWFLDRSLMWHFIASDFTSYYRLMLMHLGLPQWEYALTEMGLSLQAKQWFNLYAPVRLSHDENNGKKAVIGALRDEEDVSSSGSGKIDFTKLFRGKVSEKQRIKQIPGQVPNRKKGNMQTFSSANSIKSTNSSRSIGGRNSKPWT